MKRILQLLIAFLATINLAFAAIDINSASESDLDKLPGIGPAKAKAIIEDRKANGPFKSPEDIKRVKGIGDKTFEELKSQITVKGGSVPAPSKAETKPSAPPTATTGATKVDAKPVATPLPVPAAAKPAAPAPTPVKPAGSVVAPSAPAAVPAPAAPTAKAAADVKSQPLPDSVKPAGLKKDAPKYTDKPVATDRPVDATDKAGSKPKKAKAKAEDRALDKAESTGNAK